MPLRRSPSIELVIFDCDGVLVDSEVVTNRVFAQMLGELGLVVTLEEMFEQFVGKTLAQCLLQVRERFGTGLPEGFADDYRRRSREALVAQTRAMPGIVAALDAIELPCAVASNGSHAKMRITLERAGLLRGFEGRVFSADDVAHGKPAPDVYLHAARTMGVEPEACVVVEDSPTGVTAGSAAGMIVFGYAAHIRAQRLRDAGAADVFDDMMQLPDLLRRLAVQRRVKVGTRSDPTSSTS
jgi:HAD superfamily hydrolase (TIGR01509 family)